MFLPASGLGSPSHAHRLWQKRKVQLSQEERLAQGWKAACNVPSFLGHQGLPGIFLNKCLMYIPAFAFTDRYLT